MAKQEQQPEPSFEEMTKRLEAIVIELDKPIADVELDTMMANVDEAVKLLQSCKQHLKRHEEHLAELKKEIDSK